MTTDRDIQRTIETGQQNQNTVELIRNWCAHARIEKFGGVGLIEQQTGLPVGHHSVKCDHASEAGFASWDLREAALDFYDRNCAECKFRKPAGFPTLAVLVKQRDDARAAQAAEKAKVEAKLAQELEARRLRRSEVRRQLSAVSGTILDHIQDYDEQRDKEHRDRLCESARLAPEHFVPILVEYLFELTEKEGWFAEAGLTVLDTIGADDIRLARLAIVAVRNPLAAPIAADILLKRAAMIEASEIGASLVAIIRLASPDRPFFHEQTEPVRPQLLYEVWDRYRAEITKGIDALLASRHLHTVELGGRALTALLDHDAGAATPFARSLVSKFARANILVDDFDDLGHGFVHVRDALVGAFQHAPNNVDSIIQDFISGSDRASRARAFKIYAAVLRDGRRSEEPLSADSPPHRLAFRRLLSAATSEEEDDVLRTIQEVFHGRPYELEKIACAEFDQLLGTALVMDDRLRRHDEEPWASNNNMLEALERQNRRSTLQSLMSSFFEWASISAADNIQLIKKIMALFDILPDGRDEVRGALLSTVEHIGATVEGLKLILPHLYYGLVGPSALVRSYAASAVGELPYRARDNLPPLVFEAFSVLLWDQYVVVHKSAVHALRHIRLPENCRGRMAQALLNLIRYYDQKGGEDHFVVECVELLADELHRLDKAKGNVGRYLVQVLGKADPLYVRSELRFLSRTLGSTDGFASVVIRQLPEIDHINNRDDCDELKALADLPDSAVLGVKEALKKAGMELILTQPWIAAHIIEELTRAGAWEEACCVAEAGFQGEATIRSRSRRIFSRGAFVAVSFERAIAQGDVDRLPELLRLWEDNLEEERKQKADEQKRSSRSSFPNPF